ncbi:MAG: hypothetical protein SFV19_17630 [Rhodospirillaceae bacterium]|nr:hypothetical protein [Rhodospirillaceae bacterium]
MTRTAAMVMAAALTALSAATAQAMCIENRSDRNIAFVRGEPFAEMAVLYQGVVPPRGFTCAPMPMRADGTTPISIYVVDDRGRCATARGCLYENRDDQNVFVGAGANNCLTAFNVDYCPAKN